MNKKYVVYQHVTPDGMYYFGVTNNPKRRWKNNGAEYKGTSLYPYIEKFGWDNIKHIILFENQTRENALFIENFLIETAQEDGVCINQRRSGLVSKEEGYDKKQSKQYYETNKGQVQERHKQYYQKNREKELEWRRQRYQKNRDEINEQRRQRYQRKKEEKQFKEFGCIPLW